MRLGGGFAFARSARSETGQCLDAAEIMPRAPDGRSDPMVFMFFVRRLRDASARDVGHDLRKARYGLHLFADAWVCAEFFGAQRCGAARDVSKNARQLREVLFRMNAGFVGRAYRHRAGASRQSAMRDAHTRTDRFAQKSPRFAPVRANRAALLTWCVLHHLARGGGEAHDMASAPDKKSGSLEPLGCCAKIRRFPDLAWLFWCLFCALSLLFLSSSSRALLSS